MKCAETVDLCGISCGDVVRFQNGMHGKIDSLVICDGVAVVDLTLSDCGTMSTQYLMNGERPDRALMGNDWDIVEVLPYNTRRKPLPHGSFVQPQWLPVCAQAQAGARKPVLVMGSVVDEDEEPIDYAEKETSPCPPLLGEDGVLPRQRNNGENDAPYTQVRPRRRMMA